jgi:hypothetical protein
MRDCVTLWWRLLLNTKEIRGSHRLFLWYHGASAKSKDPRCDRDKEEYPGPAGELSTPIALI